MKVVSNMSSYWMDKIKSAKSNVTIISPYVSGSDTVSAFINKAKNGNCTCKLVTHKDVKQHLCAGYQLDAMADILDASASILMVKGLHAKILIVDDRIVSIGSQNFTSKGEKNEELSVEVDIPWSSSDAELASLFDKVSAAKSLDSSTLKRWQGLHKEHMQKINDFEDKIRSILSAEQSKLDEDDNDSKSSKQSTSSNVSVGWSVTNKSNSNIETILLTYTRDGDMYQFKRQDEGRMRYVDYEVINLCEMSVKQRNGHMKEIVLDKASLVPMKISDSGRYVFCKLNNTRFSKFTDKVNWVGKLPYLTNKSTVNISCYRNSTHAQTFKLEVKDSQGNVISGKVLVSNQSFSWVDGNVEYVGKEAGFADVVAKIEGKKSEWLAALFDSALYKPSNKYQALRFLDSTKFFDTDKRHYNLSAEPLGKCVGLTLL